MNGLSGTAGQQCVETLLLEVAEREGVEPEELQPLYDAVDPDALEALIDSSAPETLRIEFTYSGYRVTVSGDGAVSLTTAE